VLVGAQTRGTKTHMNSIPIRVLIADDHPTITEGLTSGLRRHGLDVVDHVNASTAVIDKYTETNPDVLVLDVRFGAGPTGLDVVSKLLKQFPDARIVIFSQFDEIEMIQAAYRRGCLAFIPKRTPPAILADAIKLAFEGQTYLLPEISDRLAKLGIHGDESPHARLTPREMEVFAFMAQGLTNPQIVEKMSLSPKTISITSQNIKEKLNAHRPADITRLAIKYKIIEP